MSFRIVQEAIQLLLQDDIDRKKRENIPAYRLGTYLTPVQSTEGVLNEKRLVAVYFQEMKFERGSFRLPDPDAVYNIDLLVAADHQADLKVLSKEFETNQPDIYLRALADLKTAEGRAENMMNDLIQEVYQVIMNPRNHRLGLDRWEPAVDVGFGNRDIVKIDKGPPDSKSGGNLVTLDARMTLECNFDEKIFGGEEALGPIRAGATFLPYLDVKAKSEDI